MVVTVDRSTWYRGKGPGLSRLLTSEGRMCCLGFASIEAGCSKAEIDDQAYPSTVRLEYQSAGREFPEALKALVSDEPDSDGSSALGNKLAAVNDDPDISDETREYTLQALGVLAGISFRFEGRVAEKAVAA